MEARHSTTTIVCEKDIYIKNVTEDPTMICAVPDEYLSVCIEAICKKKPEDFSDHYDPNGEPMYDDENYGDNYEGEEDDFGPLYNWSGLFDIKCNLTDEFLLKILPICIKLDHWSLRAFRPQTEEMCLLAVKVDGNALKHVDEQTLDICTAAVNQSCIALKYVKEELFEECFLAQCYDEKTGKYEWSIINSCSYDDELVRRLLTISLPIDPHSFFYIEIQDDDICNFAIGMNSLVLAEIEEQTEYQCELAISENGLALEYVEKRFKTDELCKEAVNNNGVAIRFIRTPSVELCLDAVRQEGLALKFIKKQTPEICLAAVQKNPLALQFVKDQTTEMCLSLVKQNGMLLQYVNVKTPEIVDAAVKQNRSAMVFVTQDYDFANEYGSFDTDSSAAADTVDVDAVADTNAVHPECEDF